MDRLNELEEYTEQFSSAPTLDNMPRRSLADKGIAGPTSAHVIEEVHTPFNLAYITTTTGSTAFQNITGVPPHEIPGRIAASEKALSLSGVKRGSRILFTYPPLVNVFPREALEDFGVTWSFLKASSRDALLLALCKEKPEVVIGESSFLRAALEDSVKIGLHGLLPENTIFLAAGTPMDREFPAVAEKLCRGKVHDLYGCQEFGWLALDGIPLREDVVMVPTETPDHYDLLVGGLPTGDCFPVLDSGHVCNREGRIITYARVRTPYELETTITATTAAGRETVERLCRTVLRIKAKIVRVSPHLRLRHTHTAVTVATYDGECKAFHIDEPDRCLLLDSLLRAQMDYQSHRKTDPTWIKGR